MWQNHGVGTVTTDRHSSQALCIENRVMRRLLTLKDGMVSGIWPSEQRKVHAKTEGDECRMFKRPKVQKASRQGKTSMKKNERSS